MKCQVLIAGIQYLLTSAVLTKVQIKGYSILSCILYETNGYSGM